MKKEEMAEYIVRNLIFIVIFLLLAFYAFANIILPRIQDYKVKRDDLRHTQLVYTKETERNTQLNLSIDKIQSKNQALLELLQSPPSIKSIQGLAQTFFDVTSVKSAGEKYTKDFSFKIYKIEGTTTTPQTFFDFTKKFEQSFPSASIILPFSIEKETPLDETLKITVHIQIVQMR